MISEVKIRSNYLAGQQLIIAKPTTVLFCLDTSAITYHASLVANGLGDCVGVAYDKDVSQKCTVRAHVFMQLQGRFNSKICNNCM